MIQLSMRELIWKRIPTEKLLAFQSNNLARVFDATAEI